MLKSINTNIVLSALLIISQLTLLPILVSTYGSANYGKYVIYKSISHQGIIALFAFGTNLVLRRDFSALNIPKVSILDLNIVLKLSICVVPLLFLLAAYLPNEYSMPRPIIFGILMLELILVYLTSILEGMKRITLIRFFDVLYIFLLLVLVSTSKLDFFYCILSIYIFNIMRLIIYLSVNFNFSPKRFSPDWQDILNSTKYLGLSNIFSIINNNYEKYIITFILGIEAIVYLDILQKVVKIFKNQIGIFTTLVQPYYQKIRIPAQDYTILLKLQNSFCVINFCIAILSFYYSPWFLKIWMGQDFVFLSEYINYGMIALNFYFINSFIGMTLTLSKEYQISLKIQIIVTLIRVLFTIVAMPFIGLWTIVVNVYLLGVIVWIAKVNIPRIYFIRVTLAMTFLFFILDTFYFTQLHRFSSLTFTNSYILFIFLILNIVYFTYSFLFKAHRLLAND